MTFLKGWSQTRQSWVSQDEWVLIIRTSISVHEERTTKTHRGPAQIPGIPSPQRVWIPGLKKFRCVTSCLSPLHTGILILDSVHPKTRVGIQGLPDPLHQGGKAWFGLMFLAENQAIKPNLGPFYLLVQPDPILQNEADLKFFILVYLIWEWMHWWRVKTRDNLFKVLEEKVKY